MLGSNGFSYKYTKNSDVKTVKKMSVINSLQLYLLHMFHTYTNSLELNVLPLNYAK